MAEKAPASSGEPQEENHMEPNSEDISERKEHQDRAEHAKMPEHPGRDSDSDGEDSGEEQEQ